MARQAPIWGILGIYNTYLAHKQDQREQERLDIERSRINIANELAKKTYEQEYGTAVPDYNRPQIGGVADYADVRGEEVLNYPEKAYRVKRTKGLQHYRAETARLNVGEKAYLYQPISQEMMDKRLEFLQNFDAQYGTNIMAALQPFAIGIQKEIGKGTPLIEVANKFDKVVKANKKNLLQRLELAGDHEQLQALKQALKNDTFSEMFFPVPIPHIRMQKAQTAAQWTGTKEAAEYGRETKKQVAGIYAKAWGGAKSKIGFTAKDLITSAKNRMDYVNKRHGLAQDAMGNIIVQDEDGKKRPATKEEIEEMRRNWGEEYDEVIQEAGIRAKPVKGKVTKKQEGLQQKTIEIVGEGGPPEPVPRQEGESLAEYLKRVKGSVTF